MKQAIWILVIFFVFLGAQAEGQDEKKSEDSMSAVLQRLDKLDSQMKTVLQNQEALLDEFKKTRFHSRRS